MVMPYPLIHSLGNRTRMLDPHLPLAFRKHVSACLLYLAVCGKQGQFVLKECFSRKRRRKLTSDHWVLQCMRCTRCCPVGHLLKGVRAGVRAQAGVEELPLLSLSPLWARWAAKLRVRESGGVLTALPSFHLFNSSLIEVHTAKPVRGCSSHPNPKSLTFTAHYFLWLLPLTQSLWNSCLPKPIVLASCAIWLLPEKGFHLPTKH